MESLKNEKAMLNPRGTQSLKETILIFSDPECCHETCAFQRDASASKSPFSYLKNRATGCQKNQTGVLLRDRDSSNRSPWHQLNLETAKMHSECPSPNVEECYPAKAMCSIFPVHPNVGRRCLNNKSIKAKIIKKQPDKTM